MVEVADHWKATPVYSLKKEQAHIHLILSCPQIEQQHIDILSQSLVALGKLSLT